MEDTKGSAVEFQLIAATLDIVFSGKMGRTFKEALEKYIKSYQGAPKSVKIDFLRKHRANYKLYLSLSSQWRIR